MAQNEAIIILGGSGEIGSFIANSLREKYQIISIHKDRNVQKDTGFTEIVADLTEIKVLPKLFQQLFDQYNIKAIINCVGLNNSYELNEIDEQKWDEVLDVNLKSLFFVCKYIREYSNDNKLSIINFSSTAGIKPQLSSPHYIAAKSGVNALTKYFAAVYAPDIRVNAVAPGYVLTESHKPEKYAKYDEIIKRIPMRRMANFDEILSAIEYLLNNEYITGQIVAVDGGITI